MIDIAGAFLLAAGLGSRLAPITKSCPKPLLPVLGISFLKRLINELRLGGISNFFINTHHLSNQVIDQVSRWQADIPSCRFVTSHEKEILGTSGFALNFRQEIEPSRFYLILPADILVPNLWFHVAHVLHELSSTIPDVLLFLHRIHVPGTTKVWWEAGAKFIGFGEDLSGPGRSYGTFTGIYLCKGEHLLHDHIQTGLSSPRVEFIDWLSLLLARKANILTSQYGGYWSDLGTPASFLQGNLQFLDHVDQTLWSASDWEYVSDGVMVALGSVEVVGPSLIHKESIRGLKGRVGPRVVLGPDVTGPSQPVCIDNSCVFNSVIKPDNTNVSHQIVGFNQVIQI